MEKLDAYRIAARPIKIITRDRTYESMAMMSLTVPKTAKRATRWSSQRRLKRFASSRTEPLINVVAKAPKSHKKVDAGKQPTAKQTPERYRSILDSTTGDESIAKAQGFIRSFGVVDG